MTYSYPKPKPKKLPRVSLRELRSLVKKQEEEMYPWDSDMRPNGRAAGVDVDAARELVLFTENEGRLWGPGNTQGAAIRKNIDEKIRRGTLDETKLPKLFEYLMESAAKMYDSREWKTIFSPATRRHAAKEMAEEYVQELQVTGRLTRNGEYNGHASRAAWNVSAWISNDQGLYETAQDCIKNTRSKDAAAREFLAILHENEVTHTPDGYKFSLSSVKAAMRDL